jgi:hypothetical protein
MVADSERHHASFAYRTKSVHINRTLSKLHIVVPCSSEFDEAEKEQGDSQLAKLAEKRAAKK